MKSVGVVLKQIIKNIDIPICNDCAYFKSHSSKIQLGKCMKFGEKHLISGKIYYSYASVNRADEELCGPNGLYFTKDPRTPKI